MKPLLRYFLIFTLLLGLSPPVLAKDDKLKSSVFILLDYSTSYYHPNRMATIEGNIRNLTTALTEKSSGLKTTALVQVLPITEISQQARPICEFKLLRKKRINIGQKKNRCGSMEERRCSDNQKKFKIYLNDICAKTLLSREHAKATDISGSLSIVSQLAKAQADGGKYLIILSDMFEYRIDEISVSRIDLSGFNVMVVCHSELLAEKNSKNKWCVDTESEWAPKFKKLGAKKVFYTVETAKWYTKISKDFFSGS
jgi:hypothetical protein